MSFETNVFQMLFIALQLFFGAETTEVHPSPQIEYGKVVAVIDGDTIDVVIDSKRERVRYIGIDTPEFIDGQAECYADEATKANQALVLGNVVRLEPDQENRDRFGRLLRYVYVDEILVNDALVRDGFATTLTIPPNTRFASAFSERQSLAQSEGRGLWAECQ